MKKINEKVKWRSFVLILAGMCLFMISCTKGKTKSVNDIPFSATTSPEVLSVEEIPMQYINSVKGHKEEEIICGSFVEGSVDTLYVTETKDKYTFKVFSSNLNIPVLKLENTVCPSLVNEGDLDGNGTTEVGILDTWNTSSCRLYRIYTLQNNKWCYLVPPLETSESVRASGFELAEPTGIKNRIRLRYADFEAPLSSCSSSPIKDTIVIASFLSIE